jgi:ribosomal protein S8E
MAGIGAVATTAAAVAPAFATAAPATPMPKSSVGGSTIGGEKTYEKLVSMHGTFEKVLTRADKTAMFTAAMQADTKQSKMELVKLNTSANELVRLNKNLQSLIDAMLTNNQNDGQIRLMIDGKQVTRVIKRREENETASSPTTG